MRRSLRHILPLALAVALGFASGARGDIVRLKNGNTLRGEIVREDAKTVTLRVTYGTVAIDRSQVASVEKEDALKTLAGEADALVRAGRTDDAIEMLETALRQNPDSRALAERLASAYRRKAEGLAGQGKPLDAEKAWRRVLELTPSDDEAEEELRKVEEVRKNAPSAEKEAQLLVMLGREREALEMFDGLEAVSPGTAARNAKSVARARALYGRRLLEFKRFVEAKRQYDLALKLDPTLLAGLKHEVFVSRFSVITMEMNEKGPTLAHARWEVLLAELQALEEIEPDSLQLRFAIAVCLHELERLDEAALAYARIAGEKVDPDKAAEQLAALQALAREKAGKAPVYLSFPETRFKDARPGPPQVLESVHFVIHHHNDEMAVLVARAAEYWLERNWRIFAKGRPENPFPKKCDIYLYRSREEYLERSHQADWSPAMATTTAVDGRLERHAILTYQAVEDLFSANLPHEITHIIHGAVVNYSSSIPTWLREGTAVRQEPWFKRLRMAMAIREAHAKGTLMTLDQIVNQKGYPDAALINVFYSQSYALVEAIHRSGTREQFSQFCRLAQSAPVMTVLSQVYGIDSDELRRRWEKHQEDLISLLEDH